MKTQEEDFESPMGNTTTADTENGLADQTDYPETTDVDSSEDGDDLDNADTDAAETGDDLTDEDEDPSAKDADGNGGYPDDEHALETNS